MVGVVTDSTIVSIEKNRLIARDRQTGEELWTRRGLPINAELWGNAEVACVASPIGVAFSMDSTRVDCYQTLDGSFVASHVLPNVVEWDVRGADFGQLMPIVGDPTAFRKDIPGDQTTVRSKSIFGMYDCVTGKTVSE